LVWTWPAESPQVKVPSALLPHTMLSLLSQLPGLAGSLGSPGSQSLPQTMSSAAELPHTTLSPAAELPHTTLSVSSPELPQTMLSSVLLPQVMLSQSFASHRLPHRMLSFPSVLTTPQLTPSRYAFAEGSG